MKNGIKKKIEVKARIDELKRIFNFPRAWPPLSKDFEKGQDYLRKVYNNYISKRIYELKKTINEEVKINQM